MKTPQIVCDIPCQVGEGPLWRPDEKKLYWTDILTGQLFRYDPATGEHEECYKGRTVGGFTLQEDGALLLFLEEGTIVTWRDGKQEKVIVQEIPEQKGRRFNDVIADPQGRVFCGILGDHRVQDDVLYRLDTDGSLTVVQEKVGTSNGMGFSPDRKTFYFTDTTIDTIWAFDYREEDGAITNRRVFVDLSDEQIKPDGMTVDARGDVWTAMALGGCVIRYSPDGAERERIRFPVKLITSAIFGGASLETLYVTTGMGHERGPEWGEKAGSLFRVDPGVLGLPEYHSKIGL